MTEKEFLIKFIKTFAPKEEEHPSGSEEYMSEYVNEFLEEHHKEYFEVEFIKIDEEDVGIDSKGNPYKRTIFK